MGFESAGRGALPGLAGRFVVLGSFMARSGLFVTTATYCVNR